VATDTISRLAIRLWRRKADPSRGPCLRNASRHGHCAVQCLGTGLDLVNHKLPRSGVSSQGINSLPWPPSSVALLRLLACLLACSAAPRASSTSLASTSRRRHRTVAPSSSSCSGLFPPLPGTQVPPSPHMANREPRRCSPQHCAASVFKQSPQSSRTRPRANDPVPLLVLDWRFSHKTRGTASPAKT
jgi:hypothetical protein